MAHGKKQFYEGPGGRRHSTDKKQFYEGHSTWQGTKEQET